jgi:nicotinamide mononucleotide transporter
MSPAEIAGTVLGVLGVALMIRQNLWGWPVGIVQVSVYAWVFFDAKLYSDALLQLIFLGLQAYGWAHWLRHRHVGARSELPVARLGAAAAAGWIAAGAVATGAWGTLMHRWTDAALPYGDAFVLMFSLVAQWLQARKVRECWIGWMVVNTVAVGVFWLKDLHLTAGLYVVFWLMALWGWRAWGAAPREAGA